MRGVRTANFFRLRRFNALGLELDPGGQLPSRGRASHPYRWAIAMGYPTANGARNAMINAAAARVIELRRPSAHQSSAVDNREATRIERLLTYFEARVRSDCFLTDGRMSAADLVLGVALQYFDFRYKSDWRKAAPRLAQRLESLANRMAFNATLPPGFSPV